MELQNGHIPIKGIKVDPEVGVLTIDGDVMITGNLSVEGTLLRERLPPHPIGSGTVNVHYEDGTINPGVNPGLYYFGPSSRRYKSNIADVDLSEARRILGISAKSFTYDSAPTEKRIGVIAEDLDALGLKEYVKYDEQGRPDRVDYQAMVPPLIEIVKDLASRLEALEESNKLLHERLA